MKTVQTAQVFTDKGVGISVLIAILPIVAFIVTSIAAPTGAIFLLLGAVATVSILRLSSKASHTITERDALMISDNSMTFVLGVMHFAALPLAMYSITFEGQTFIGWMLYVLTFGAFFGSVSFYIAHSLIHANTRMYQALGRAIFSSMRFGSYASAHMLVHHPRKDTDRDHEMVRPGEGPLRYATRVYLSGVRLGRRAENLRRKKFNYGQLDIIHPHAQYVLIAFATATLLALLFGPMGLINFFAITTVARVFYLTSGYFRKR